MSSSPNNRRTLILFDLDGTLVDGQYSIRATFDAIFPQFGYAKPDAAAVRSVVGRSLSYAIADLLGPDAPADDMAEAYKLHFHAMRATEGYREELYPDVDATMRRLAKRNDLVLGTATGKALRGINWMIEKNSWHGFFTTLQASDTAASKPSPEMVQNACRETGIAPRYTIVFGDSIYDMQMAVSGGAHAVGVSYGYGEPEALVVAGAKKIIHGFNEVEAVVAAFQEGRHA
ncbi:MAG: HAD-IA family hydrolase [Beijerinckiaceae bacterium]